MITAFTGIIAFLVLGVTRSIPAALITHGVLLLIVVVFSIRRNGSVVKWEKPRFFVPPSIIVLIGATFVVAGACIATLIEPGSDPSSMTRVDQIYFGSIFACVGGGMILTAISAWLSKEKSGRTRRGRQQDATTYPCPACGFLVFDEPPGSYAICDVCGWEDDHVQLSNPTMRGGANGNSLFEWQRHILADVPAHITEHQGFIRDTSWRPLTERDCAPDATAPTDGVSYFHSAERESPIYYWRRSPGMYRWPHGCLT